MTNLFNDKIISAPMCQTEHKKITFLKIYFILGSVNRITVPERIEGPFLV